MVLEFSVPKRQRIKEMKQATNVKAAQAKARSLAQSATISRAPASTLDLTANHHKSQQLQDFCQRARKAEAI
ncbi:hypothetical protein U0070_009015 [Myodes glareolus]|uniref:Uncharacterized protein n=1 Tax=Myodes glareolus TaxID=447135 RepID=A0AAW0JQS9_MYOGA